MPTAHVPNFSAALIHRVATRVAREGVLAFAEYHRGEFSRRILAQDFESFQTIFYPESGTNLSPRWIARKRAAGADLRTMLATHHYLNSIETFSRMRGRTMDVRVGFHHQARARNLKGEIVAITLDHLARLHEHGSFANNLPARPHWWPHLQRMHAEAPALRRRLSHAIVSAVREELF